MRHRGLLWAGLCGVLAICGLRPVQAGYSCGGGFTGCEEGTPFREWTHCSRWLTPLEPPPTGKTWTNGKPEAICKRPKDWDKPFVRFPIYVVPPTRIDLDLRMQYGLEAGSSWSSPGPPPFFILGFEAGTFGTDDGVFRFRPQADIRLSRERSEMFGWQLRYAVPAAQILRTESREVPFLYFVETLELPDYTEIYDGVPRVAGEPADGRPYRPETQVYIREEKSVHPLDGKLFPDGSYRRKAVQRTITPNSAGGYVVGNWRLQPMDPVGNYRLRIWGYGKLIAERKIEVY